MKEIALHATVSGRVQGVFFRASTQKKARALKLTGYVKNCPDGNVELIAFGPEEAVQALGKWLWQGPKLAKVTDVKSEIIPVAVYHDFEIWG